MEFKKWFEATGQKSFVTLRKKQIYDIAKKYFGKPIVSQEPKAMDLDFVLPNGRDLGISWEYRNAYTKRETISLGFEQNIDEPKSPKDKGPAALFHTSTELQRHSVNFARNLYNFVREMKDIGVVVSYSTWGRRQDVYSKWLSKANFNKFTPAGDDTGSGNAWWETNELL